MRGSRAGTGGDVNMDDTIHLTIPTSQQLLSVATLVLGGVGSRLHMSYERVDDLQLATLSTLAASDGATVTLEINARDDELTVDIGPLSAGSGADTGLRRVLDRLVDDVDTVTRDGHEWVTLHLKR
jgi:hypothetical protein